jgi:DNA-binding NarL/FixJ family response regulator
MRVLLLTPPILGAGLSTLLQQGFPQSQIRESQSLDPDETADLLPRFQPELTLIDADHVAVVPFLQCLGKLGVNSLGRILVLTAHPTEGELFLLCQWGVMAYLSALVSSEQLLSVIEAVREGNHLLSSAILGDSVLRRLRQRAEACLQEARCELALPTETPQPRPDPLPNPLKEKQQQILLLAAQGYSNGEIAARLSLPKLGMKQRLSYIYGKLNVCNRTAAVVCALQNGWIALDAPKNEEVA